ncbi:MAG: MFS transporter [Candidatus Heimdallarchaeota archaeon]|nr:MFS transporter [Candidatus Heimdallarchaeota archaeon]MCK4770431.1 MFS transporter [Candidatus Heimdallarchaeota archaeon]
MSENSTTSDTGKRDRTFALIIISVSSFISAFSGSAFTLAAPTMANELSINTTELSWIVTIYVLATAMLQIPFGKISDNYGRKKIYLTGMIIFSSSALILGFMNSATSIIIMRFVQGVGGALIFATGTAILTSVFPAQKKGFAFGINIGSVYTGLTIGPSLGGFMTEFFGWRSIFFSIVPFGFVIAILVAFVLKGEWKADVKEKFDWLGSVVFIATLFMLLYGFRSLPKNYGFGLIGASAVTLVFFIFWEWKIDYPILQLRLFQNNRFFTFANLAAFTYYTATAATTLILSLYLQNILGYTAIIAGLILLARPIFQAILSPIGGKLSDTIEHRIITTLGVAFGLIGLFMLIFLDSNSSLSLIIISLILGGIGFGLFSSPNANSIMSSVSRKNYGVASALVGTMRTVGQTLSLGLVTLLFAVLLGDLSTESIDYEPLFMKSSQIAFIIFVVVCVVSLVFSYLRGKNNYFEITNINE